jgi:hypothetical protein
MALFSWFLLSISYCLRGRQELKRREEMGGIVMSELVTNCPRCKANSITFRVLSAFVTDASGGKPEYEAFCKCRNCLRSTVFVLRAKSSNIAFHIDHANLHMVEGALNQHLHVVKYVSQKDQIGAGAPEHIPANIEKIYLEGAHCLAIGCYNAAGTMFRLCLDLITESLLPEENENGLNEKKRRDLGLRLPWLFDNNKLPSMLRGLSLCVKDDGNDAAHRGTLEAVDAEDLHDFTVQILETLYTSPKRIELASERREKRRGKSGAE